MTDGQLLLAVFTAFYVIECLHWMPAQAVVLSTIGSRGGWRASKPWLAGEASAAGPALAWPLPLLGGFLVADAWPVLPDVEGLVIGEGQHGAGRRLLWSDIKPVLEQRTISLAPKAKVRCASVHGARQVLAFLEEARSLSMNERNLACERWWAQSLSVPRAHASVRRWRLAARALRLPCVLVFCMCFGWLPFLYWKHSEDHFRLLIAALALLAANALIATTWRALDRRFFGTAKTGRWAHLLHLLFLPMHTIRAHDLIGLDVAAGHHPVPLASALLPDEAFKTFAAEYWRRWRFRGPSDPLQLSSVVVLPRLRACYERLGVSIAELERNPSPLAGSQSYCPCCHAQFVIQGNACSDCFGVTTIPFSRLL